MNILVVGVVAAAAFLVVKYLTPAGKPGRKKAPVAGAKKAPVRGTRSGTSPAKAPVLRQAPAADTAVPTPPAQPESAPPQGAAPTLAPPDPPRTSAPVSRHEPTADAAVSTPPLQPESVPPQGAAPAVAPPDPPRTSAPVSRHEPTADAAVPTPPLQPESVPPQGAAPAVAPPDPPRTSAPARRHEPTADMARPSPRLQPESAPPQGAAPAVAPPDPPRTSAPARPRKKVSMPGEGSPERGARRRTPPPAAPDRGADLYFLPVGPLPRHHLQAIETYFSRHTRLRIACLPMVPVTPEMLAGERNQLVAEKLIAAVLKSLPEITANSRAVVIGITPMDMFTVEQNWKYVYAKREGSHCAVISSARMTLAADGSRTDEETYLARIRKMVAKTIGLQYYGLDTNWDHASVMYGNVHGMADLDRIDESTISRDILIPGERQRQQTRHS